jgi:hypothetical protein
MAAEGGFILIKRRAIHSALSLPTNFSSFDNHRLFGEIKEATHMECCSADEVKDASITCTMSDIIDLVNVKKIKF